MIWTECPMCHGESCGRCTNGRMPALDAALLAGEIYAPTPIRHTRRPRGPERYDREQVADALRAAVELCGSSYAAVSREAGLPAWRLNRLLRCRGVASQEELEALERVLGPLELEEVGHDHAA